VHSQNWAKIEMIFAKNLHVTPLELDKMEFYRIEYILGAYEEFIEQENQQHKEQEMKYEKQSQQQQNSYGKMDYGNAFKTPNIQIPNFNGYK
jgi:hypothetical protein